MKSCKKLKELLEIMKNCGSVVPIGPIQLSQQSILIVTVIKIKKRVKLNVSLFNISISIQISNS